MWTSYSTDRQIYNLTSTWTSYNTDSQIYEPTSMLTSYNTHRQIYEPTSMLTSYNTHRQIYEPTSMWTRYNTIKLSLISLVSGVVVRIPPCNVRALGSITIREFFFNILCVIFVYFFFLSRSPSRAGFSI